MRNKTDFITLPKNPQGVTPVFTDTYTLKPMPLRVHTYTVTPSMRRERRQNKIKIVCAILIAILVLKLLSCFHFVGGHVTWLDSMNNIVSVTASDGSVYEFKADTDTYRLHAPVSLIMFDNNTDDVTDNIIVGDVH